MEMGQRIYFWYQILLKMMISWENDKKNHFFGQKFLWQANKNSFELKMLKFLGNHVIFDKKVQKMRFSWKKSKFWLFFLNNSKNLRLGEKNKRTVPRAKYSLHDKSNDLDFLWLIFELFGLKNCQKPSKLNSKKSPI